MSSKVAPIDTVRGCRRPTKLKLCASRSLPPPLNLADVLNAPDTTGLSPSQLRGGAACLDSSCDRDRRQARTPTRPYTSNMALKCRHNLLEVPSPATLEPCARQISQNTESWHIDTKRPKSGPPSPPPGDASQPFGSKVPGCLDDGCIASVRSSRRSSNCRLSPATPTPRLQTRFCSCPASLMFNAQSAVGRVAFSKTTTHGK